MTYPRAFEILINGGDYRIPALHGYDDYLYLSTARSNFSLTQNSRRKFAENPAIMVPDSNGNTA
jgi:hypothetical protein